MDNFNNLIVVKHNAIVQGGYRLSLMEARIVHICIAKIDSTKEIALDQVFTVRAQELSSMAKVDPRNAYKELEKAVKTLYSRSIRVSSTDGDYSETRWVSSVVYHKNVSELEIMFSQKIIPFISLLKKEFTQYRLENIMRFSSTFSIRIYELLVQWKNHHKKVVTLDWLKEHLLLSDRYNRIDNLKKRVLDVAVKEINEHSDMQVSYEQIKQGRSITGFIFYYSFKETQINKSYIEKYARPGETYPQAKNRLNK